MLKGTPIGARERIQSSICKAIVLRLVGIIRIEILLLSAMTARKYAVSAEHKMTAVV